MNPDTGITRSFAAEGESVCEAVVQAVADAKQVSPIDLDTRLYEVVDPDALDALFRSTTGSVDSPRVSPSVSLTLDGCLVTIDDGQVTAARPAESPVGSTGRAVE